MLIDRYKAATSAEVKLRFVSSQIGVDSRRRMRLSESFSTFPCAFTASIVEGIQGLSYFDFGSLSPAKGDLRSGQGSDLAPGWSWREEGGKLDEFIEATPHAQGMGVTS